MSIEDTPLSTMPFGQLFVRWSRAAWAAALGILIASNAFAQVFIANGMADDEAVPKGGFTVKKVDAKITDALSDFSRYSEKQAWEKAFKAVEKLAETEVTGMLPAKDGFFFPARQAVMKTFLSMPPDGREAYRLFNDPKAKQLFEQAAKHPDSSDDDVPTLRKLLGLYFVTSVGHKAADRLGDDLFEAGDFGGAEQAWAAIIDQQAESDLNIPRIQLKRGIAMVRTRQLSRAKEILAWLKEHASGSKMTIGGKEVEPAEYLQTLIDPPTPPPPTGPATQASASVVKEALPPLTLPESDTPKWHFKFSDEGVAEQIASQIRNFGWQNI